jgi:hypothetical protein
MFDEARSWEVKLFSFLEALCQTIRSWVGAQLTSFSSSIMCSCWMQGNSKPSTRLPPLLKNKLNYGEWDVKSVMESTGCRNVDKVQEVSLLFLISWISLVLSWARNVWKCALAMGGWLWKFAWTVCEVGTSYVRWARYSKLRFNGSNIDSSPVSMQGLNLVIGVVLYMEELHVMLSW